MTESPRARTALESPALAQMISVGVIRTTQAVQPHLVAKGSESGKQAPRPVFPYLDLIFSRSA
jgi:hypothetical protein